MLWLQYPLLSINYLVATKKASEEERNQELIQMCSNVNIIAEETKRTF